MTADEFREHVKAAMKQRDIDQKQLANEIGMSASYLSDILTRKREPSGRLLKAFGVRRIVEYSPVVERHYE